MGLVKTVDHMGKGGNHLGNICYFPNEDGLERDESNVVGLDSGDDSDDCATEEMGFEFGMLGGQMCSIPYELYDLPDLKEILSLETWNSCLTDEERFSLSAYLPDMDQQTFWLTMRELLSGNNMFFGSPLVELFERLKGGFYPPKVTRFRESLQFLQRRAYYHSLRLYHENMAQTFSNMKRMWDKCRPSSSIEERILIWKVRKNHTGKDPLDLNAYPVDEDLTSKNLNLKTALLPSAKTTKYIDPKGETTKLLPPVASGMKLVSSNTSGKGVLKIKPAGMGSQQTCFLKTGSNYNWAQSQPTPKGVLKIVPKRSTRQEHSRTMSIYSEPTKLTEAPVLQTSRFSPSPASLYNWDVGDYDGESSFPHKVRGRKAYRSPEVPDYMDRQRVDLLNSTIGPSRNLQNSIRKVRRAKNQSFDAIRDLPEHSLFGSEPGEWNRDENSAKGGHLSSRNSLDGRKLACESENLRQNLRSREPSQSSLESFQFGTEYYQGEKLITPKQEKYITKHPRISEVASRISGAGIEEHETVKISSDRTKRHRDVSSAEGSHKLCNQLSISEGLRDGVAFPITYKRRKTQMKPDSLDFIKPLATGSDYGAKKLKEENHRLGESVKAVKIKFKNWDEKSLNKQGIVNGLQYGSPSA
ncbi:PREDICTED: uncharacterized protein LOC104608295 [Nelumbo nucifera]|uniref:Uncharacterized protein LOC104608295 n=2 Tax=Nelumbo nucifera TaxID=4432 RepID=A0A1U8B8C3_NELNU|nr:PREDICTED: uncharacterized protein LOC104608295 [Nelumbo nucifera]XP_010272538.1 PREDICTED: uncharacterized protein LOC104608295 [Nelumbo nucifera]DAD24317.1 TPA_asm: hypothetical protein HUJ06_025781 [Nelumbo nucifera]